MGKVVFKKDNTIDCRKCKHYYITWDKKFPYGCRAMGFKGREQPCWVVYRSSGIRCQLFAKKESRTKAKKSR